MSATPSIANRQSQTGNAQSEILRSAQDDSAGKRPNRGGGKRLTARTRAALFAEWKKLSPNLVQEGVLTERELRIEWTNGKLAGGRSHVAGGEENPPTAFHLRPTISSWSDLTEGQGKFLLKKMKEDSGSQAEWLAVKIGKLAADIFGSAWDRLLSERLSQRFRKARAVDLTGAEAHACIEEFESRIARRDGVSIEEARKNF